MKEKDGIRLELERLDRMFPRKELLTQKEASEFTGMSISTIKKYIPRNPNGKMSKYAIAQYILSTQ